MYLKFFRDMIPVEFGFKENDRHAVHNQHPAAAGMAELLHTPPEKRDDLEDRYPDAAFALMVAGHLSMGNQEQNAIHQKAYLSILGGEPVQNVRFRYDYDLEQYLERHMWD